MVDYLIETGSIGDALPGKLFLFGVSECTLKVNAEYGKKVENEVKQVNFFGCLRILNKLEDRGSNTDYRSKKLLDELLNAALGNEVCKRSDKSKNFINRFAE